MEFKKEPLGGGVTAVVSEAHSFGTDAFLLAYFAAPKKRDKLCDLGTGCGIIPLLFVANGCCSHITAVDIQPQACAQLNEAIEINGLHAKVKAVCADLREAKALPEAGSFDVVTINPPYFTQETGFRSREEASAIARCEEMCTVADVAAAAARLLRFGGRLCLCHRPERIVDVICELRARALEPKRLRCVTQKPGGKPWLILIEARLGGGRGLVFEPELVIESDEMAAVLGEYSNKRAEAENE